MARQHEAAGHGSPRSDCSSPGVVSLMMHHVEEELGEYIASLGRRVELLLERSDQLWDMQAGRCLHFLLPAAGKGT